MGKRASASKRAVPAPSGRIEPPGGRVGPSSTEDAPPPAAPPGQGGAAVPAFEGQYRVELPSFEGPLDLLLHLIQQHEIDILDIPVSFITEKYLDYLRVMRSLAIDIASEYLVMAATLVHIKSKMLLPSVPAGQEDDSILTEEEDPRAELVRRLLEYQKYKAAAAELAERGTLGRDVFMRGVPEATPEGPAPLAPVGVFSLLDAFEKVLKRTNVKLDHEVVFDRISITDRIIELTEKLSERRSMRFEDLLVVSTSGGPTRFDLVITFLAVLEMARLKLIKVYQSDPLAPIHVEFSGGGRDGGDEPTEAPLGHAGAEAVEEPPVRASEEPVVEEQRGPAGTEPVVEEPPVRASEGPVVEERRGQVGTEAVLEEQREQVGTEPVVEEQPVRASEEPVVEERRGQVGDEPAVEEPAVRASEEPVVEEQRGQVDIEPVVEEPPVRVNEEPVIEEQRGPVGDEQVEAQREQAWTEPVTAAQGEQAWAEPSAEEQREQTGEGAPVNRSFGEGSDDE